MMRILWVIPFLILGSLAQAQNFRAGAIAAVNGSQLDGDGFSGYNKPGIYAGLFVARDFKPQWYWQLELAYSGKGSQRVLRPDNLDEGPWLRLSMHYIDIPFTVHYRYRENWHFHAGLGANFLVNFNYRDLRLLTLNTDFRRWETAMHLGTTYELTPKIKATARFSYSMLSVDPNGPPVPFFALLQRGAFNNVLSLGIRYQLRG